MEVGNKRVAGLAGDASPCLGKERAMKLNNLDRLHQAKDLVKGLRDTMLYIETAEQDKLIPITILGSFEVVLEKVYSLLKEIDEAGD